MRKRSWLLFGTGLVAGLSNSLGKVSKSHKQHQSQTLLPLLYAGTWQYKDENRNRIHYVEISQELKLTIDQRPIEAQVKLVDSHNLIFIDSFGYHITFTANESRPVQMMDEADDQVYIINSVK